MIRRPVATLGIAALLLALYQPVAADTGRARRTAAVRRASAPQTTRAFHVYLGFDGPHSNTGRMVRNDMRWIDALGPNRYWSIYRPPARLRASDGQFVPPKSPQVTEPDWRAGATPTPKDVRFGNAELLLGLARYSGQEQALYDKLVVDLRAMHAKAKRLVGHVGKPNTETLQQLADLAMDTVKRGNFGLSSGERYDLTCKMGFCVQPAANLAAGSCSFAELPARTAKGSFRAVDVGGHAVLFGKTPRGDCVLYDSLGIRGKDGGCLVVTDEASWKAADGPVANYHGVHAWSFGFDAANGR